MRLDVLWHDLECSAYDQDPPLWRALAAETGGVVLDVGAGTGRVSLDLCRWRRAVVALDTDASLLAALERRGAGLPIETVVADAMTLLCLGGSRSCSSRCRPSSYSGRPCGFLRCALEHLAPGGLLAAPVADAMDCFDAEHDLPPPACAMPATCSRWSKKTAELRSIDDVRRRARRAPRVDPSRRAA